MVRMQTGDRERKKEKRGGCGARLTCWAFGAGFAGAGTSAGSGAAGAGIAGAGGSVPSGGVVSSVSTIENGKWAGPDERVFWEKISLKRQVEFIFYFLFFYFFNIRNKMSSRGTGRGRGRAGTARSSTAPATKTALTQEWCDALGGKQKGQEFASLLSRIEQDGEGKSTADLCSEIRVLFFNFTRGLTIDGEKLESKGKGSSKPRDSYGWVRARDQPQKVVERLISCVRSELILPIFPLSDFPPFHCIHPRSCIPQSLASSVCRQQP